jgi:hypothetical protein
MAKCWAYEPDGIFELVARILETSCSQQQSRMIHNKWDKLASVSFGIMLKLSVFHRQCRLVHIHGLASSAKLLQELGIVPGAMDQKRPILLGGHSGKAAKDTDRLAPERSCFCSKSGILENGCCCVEPIHECA